MNGIPDASRIRIDSEIPSFEGHLNLMRAEMMENVALGFLVSQQHGMAFQAIASAMGHLKESNRDRDESLAARILSAHRRQPEAVHIVIRGRGHESPLSDSLTPKIGTQRAAQEFSDLLGPAFRYQAAGFPPANTAEGRRLLLEILLNSSIMNYFDRLKLPPEQCKASLDSVTAGIPLAILNDWFAQVPVLQQGRFIDLLGETTWQWLGSHQVDIGDEGRRLYAQLQAKLEKPADGGIPGVFVVDTGLEETEAHQGALLERWQGMRLAAPELRTVVIGRSVADRFPALRVLARLGENFLVDEGADTIVGLIERGVNSVAYYGGLEEFGAFAALAGQAMIAVEARSPAAPEFLAQLREILALAGVPQDVLSAGLEEFAAELGSLAVGA